MSVNQYNSQTLMDLTNSNRTLSPFPYLQLMYVSKYMKSKAIICQRQFSGFNLGFLKNQGFPQGVQQFTLTVSIHQVYKRYASALTGPESFD